MKGNIKITIEETNDTGTFPVKETFTIERDNTYEVLDDWISVFKKILYCQGFHENLINDIFPEGE